MLKTYIIGAGGAGSILTPVLCRLSHRSRVIVVDGDKLEQRNLDRQMYSENDIGRFKAEALAEQNDCSAIAEWFRCGLLSLDNSDYLVCCADNHPARREVLDECDRAGCSCIIAGNEYWSAEAYYYQPDWRGTEWDPRVFYPEIMTTRHGDPRSATIGCTGQAQEENKQLVSANAMAAALASQLYSMWTILASDASDSLPRRLWINLGAAGVVKPKQT